MLKYYIYLDGSIIFFLLFIFIPGSFPSFSFLAFMMTYPGEDYKDTPLCIPNSMLLFTFIRDSGFSWFRVVPENIICDYTLESGDLMSLAGSYPFYSAPSSLLLEQKSLGREFPPFSFCQRSISSLKS